MKQLQYLLILLILIVIFKNANAQLMTNNNVAITVQTGVQLTVQGDIRNQNSTTIDNNGTIDLNGNWINDANNNCFGTSQGTVILNGSNQNISGSNSTAFNNLVLQNNGTKTLLTAISVGGNYVSPIGILDVGNSIFDLNSKTLSITNSNVSAITSGNGYLLSEAIDNSSKVNWTINNSTGAHTIPFGNSNGELIPLTFNLTSGNAGDVTFSTYPTAANNLPLPVSPTPVSHLHNMIGTDNSANVVDRFWQIDPSGTPTASLTFTYGNSENAANGNTNMVAQRWVNPTAGWALPIAGQTNPSSQSVLVNNVTSFGPWAITTSQSPLPIVMLQFTAKAKDNNKVICNWTTATERDNDYFTVERSKDGIHFEPAGTVDGSGNTNVPHNYSYNDNKPYNGISYYRIRQTDYNGTFSYSVIRQVNISSDDDLSLEVFPNPVVDFVNLIASGGAHFKIVITDVTGKILKQIEMNTPSEKIDFTSLASGVYFLNVEDETSEKQMQIKVVKN